MKLYAGTSDLQHNYMCSSWMHFCYVRNILKQAFWFLEHQNIFINVIKKQCELQYECTTLKMHKEIKLADSFSDVGHLVCSAVCISALLNLRFTDALLPSKQNTFKYLILNVIQHGPKS